MYNLLYIVLNKFNNTSMTNNVIILFNNNCHIDRAHNRRLENGFTYSNQAVQFNVTDASIIYTKYKP